MNTPDPVLLCIPAFLLMLVALFKVFIQPIEGVGRKVGKR